MYIQEYGVVPDVLLLN